MVGHASHYSEIKILKGSFKVKTEYTCLWQMWGEGISNALKNDFLRTKGTFGYVGIVQEMKKVKKSARLFFTR